MTPAGRPAVPASTAIARALDAEMFGGLPDPALLRADLAHLARLGYRR